ncbi:hypothetical protein I6A84_12850, partial [Frankia sp. CNm7]
MTGVSTGPGMPDPAVPPAAGPAVPPSSALVAAGLVANERRAALFDAAAALTAAGVEVAAAFDQVIAALTAGAWR